MCQRNLEHWLYDSRDVSALCIETLIWATVSRKTKETGHKFSRAGLAFFWREKQQAKRRFLDSKKITESHCII